MLNKQYNLKVKQTITDLFDNIENSFIKEEIHQSSAIVLENNVLLKDSVSASSDRVFICSDICGKYNNEKSIEDFSIPNTSKYYFLNKVGSEYTFVKERPLPNKYLDDSILLGFNGLSFSNLYSNEDYKDIIQTSIETLAHQSSLNSSYRCFSFNFGGISKTSSVFYSLDNNNILEIINPSDINVLIDFIEGNVYLKKTEATDSIISVIGLFNIDPILIDKKGSLKLTESNSGFFKFLNNSDKGNISVKLLGDKYVLSSTDNIYIYTTSDNFVVDGIQLQTDYKLYIPKNPNVVIEFAYEDQLIDDFVSNTASITNENGTYDSPLIGDHLSDDNITTYPSNYGSIFIVKEIEKNTYNFDRPSILPLRNFNIE